MHSQLGCMVRFCSKGICSPTGRHSYEYTFRRGFQCRLHLLTTHSDTVIMQSLKLCRTVVKMTVSLHRARACATLSGEAPCRSRVWQRESPAPITCELFALRASHLSPFAVTYCVLAGWAVWALLLPSTCGLQSLLRCTTAETWKKLRVTCSVFSRNESTGVHHTAKAHL